MKARIMNGEYLGVYSNDFIEKNYNKIINGQLVSEWELIEVLPNENFIKPFWNNLEWEEGATQEEIIQIQLQKALDEETEKYKKRTQDGINAYAAISAEFRLAKLNGVITEEAHAYVERLLIPVRNEVLAGQWMSGLKELELIGEAQVGVDLYNRLHTQISNYIAENY